MSEVTLFNNLIFIYQFHLLKATKAITVCAENYNDK